MLLKIQPYKIEFDHDFTTTSLKVIALYQGITIAMPLQLIHCSHLYAF